MKFVLTGLQAVYLPIKKKLWKHRANKGFSLLEALTALSVLSLIMSSLLDSYMIGIRGVGKSQSQTEATIVARNVLAEIPATIITKPNRRVGRRGKFRWSVETILLDRLTTENKNTQKSWALYKLKIEVMSEANQKITLETYKIGKFSA